MRRFLAIAAVLIFVALPAAAQNTTVVTGTIKDTNGLAYANATVQAQLVPSGITPTIPPPCNGQSSTPCAVSAYSRATADVTGTFSMNLASNAVLTPGGTQWQFTVNETGVPPPLGTGSQACSATLTISGASQSVSSNFSSCPALSNAGGGTGPGSNVFNVRNYGAYGDTQSVTTGFTWNSQNSIVCISCAFTSADVGKTVYESLNNQSSGLQQYGIIGHVTAGVVDSVTSYVGSPGAGSTLVWGHVDDPAGIAISAILNVLFANPATLSPFTKAPVVYLPYGGYMLCGTNAVPAFLALNPGASGAGLTLQGDPGTVLYPCPNIPTPGFNSEWLVQNLSGGNFLGVFYNNLDFEGNYVAFNNRYSAIFAYVYQSNNVTCNRLQAINASVGLTCFAASTASQVYNFSGTGDGPGSAIGISGGGNIEFHMSRTSNNAGAGIALNNFSGATGAAGFRWIGGQIDESTCSGHNGNVDITNSYDVWFVDTSIFTCPGFAGMAVDGTSVVHLSGDVLGPFSGGTGLKVAAGGKVIATDTRFYSFEATTNCMNNLGTLVNLGGNRCEEGANVSATEAVNTVTLTTAYNHRLTNANIGDYISVAGMTPAGYNCANQQTFCWQITAVPAANTIQYSDPTGALGAGSGGFAWINTWNGGGFTGNPPVTDLTPTWNTCYYTPTWANTTTMVLCSQPNDRAMYLSRVRAVSNASITCATPPVVTLTNGNITTTLTMTSGQSSWDTSASPTTFPIASGSLPQYYAPTLPTAVNSPTVSIATGTCASPPVNLSITTFGTSPGTP